MRKTTLKDEIKLGGDLYDVTLFTGSYSDNGRTALELINSVNGEPFGVLTVNMPEIPLNPFEVIIKTYSENEGWVKRFLDRHPDVFRPTGRAADNGFVQCPIYVFILPDIKEYNSVKAEVASDWWADQIRDFSIQNNGDFITSALAMMLQDSQGKIPDDKIEVFKLHLYGLIVSKLERLDSLTLSCDYAADNILSEAAGICDIDRGCPPFPMKTVMWIRPEKIMVSLGYGAKPETIWDVENGKYPDSPKKVEVHSDMHILDKED